MNLYFISGLGADKRVFQYLQFSPSVNVVHLDWLPAAAGDTLSSYAQKMAERIDTAKPFCVIGLSLGGMIAAEISELLHPHKTILISSIASYNELPLLYRAGGKLGLHQLIPSGAAGRFNFILHYQFGIKSAEDKLLLRQVINDADRKFSKWAVNAVVHWNRRRAPKSVIRIHGTKDRVLPITGFYPDYIVEGGGHFMIVNKSNEISALIQQIISG